MGLFGSIIGAATSIIGGNSQKKAAKKAADAQVKAAQLAIDEQRRQYDLTRSDYAPYLTAGTSALGDISTLLGLTGGPDAQGGAIAELKNSPLYGSLYRNGEEAILANASATGGLRGGNTQGALYNLGADTLASVIQQQLSNLGGVANMGQGAAGSLGQFGANAAANIGNSMTQQGQALAGSALARGGINAGIWSNVGSSIGDIYKQLVPNGINLGGGIKI